MNGDRTDGGMEGEEGRGLVCIDPGQLEIGRASCRERV